MVFFRQYDAKSIGMILAYILKTGWLVTNLTYKMETKGRALLIWCTITEKELFKQKLR